LETEKVGKSGFKAHSGRINMLKQGLERWALRQKNIEVGWKESWTGLSEEAVLSHKRKEQYVKRNQLESLG